MYSIEINAFLPLKDKQFDFMIIQGLLRHALHPTSVYDSTCYKRSCTPVADRHDPFAMNSLLRQRPLILAV